MLFFAIRRMSSSLEVNGSIGSSKVGTGMILAANSLFVASDVIRNDFGSKSYLSIVHNGVEL
jgi:hypothetical protein